MPNAPQTSVLPVRLAWFRAGVGAVLWLASFLWFEPGWTLGLLWLGALVHVPLALGLVAGTSGHGALLRITSWLQTPAAILLVIAFKQGDAGFVFGVPWLLVCGLFGLAGLWRLIDLGLKRPGAFADWGLMVMVGHALWVGSDLLGWDAGGFPPVIVRLTPIHMLFAGVILNIVVAKIVAARPARVPVLAGIGVAFGYFIVAGAITANYLFDFRYLEFPSAVVYGSCVIVIGWMQLFLALWPKSRLPVFSRVMLVISDLSLGTAITLAFIYAWGTQRGLHTLTIPRMVTWHGMLNAIGFALCGLIGWLYAASFMKKATAD